MPKKFHRGFTLIELSIYMGLVAVFLVVMVNMFLATLDTQLEAEGSSSVDQDARYIITRLNYDLHRASQITAPAVIGLTSDSLGLTIGGVAYTYSLSDQNLQLSQAGTIGILNSHGTRVSAFTVTRVGFPGETAAAQINLTLQSATVDQNQNPQSRSYQTTVSLR